MLLQLDAVHTDVVEGSDFVGDRTGFVVHGADRIDNATEVFLGFFSQDVESTVTGMLCIEGVVSHPAAASVLIEIIHRRGGGVEVVEVDTRCEVGLVVTTCSN